MFGLQDVMVIGGARRSKTPKNGDAKPEVSKPFVFCLLGLPLNGTTSETFVNLTGARNL